MFCYCAQARRLARVLTARYDMALAPADLTAAQFETLSLLQAVGTSTGRVLAERLLLSKTTLSRNVKPLIDAGLISARQGDEDARQTLYVLATKGRQRLAKALPLWQAAHNASLEMLGASAAPSQHALQQMTQALR
ncbi:MarR family winged helix-turn-helix transcriptional regulator [Terriglobus roseus]|uniref:DNA-binding transcriptional regulator, MarR family n=1 Tax=Terriglobus roseus TaxID=392734 RepID=A0A1H4MV27_9BACT|nr:MarR family winged helix-turn-helix transcriptional regulator [Terriglobus roseus]SEB86528.1 DNA-binding transcriptional regulator, MarR family [Terriglobus roseus]